MQRVRATALVMLTIGMSAVTAASALAFQGQEGFVPADKLHQESVPGGVLAVAAYAVVWVAVVVYVLTLWRRAGRLERDLAELTSRVAGSGR
jgi:CcmD family protein